MAYLNIKMSPRNTSGCELPVVNDEVVTAYSQSTRNDSRRADDKIVIANTYVIGNSDQMSQKKKIQKTKRKRKEDEKRGAESMTETQEVLERRNQSGGSQT